MSTIDFFLNQKYTIEISCTNSAIGKTCVSILDGHKIIFEAEGKKYAAKKYKYDTIAERFILQSCEYLDLKNVRDIIHAECPDTLCYIVDDSLKKIIYLFEK